MPFTVTMPKLSPTMEQGVIAKWHKKEGDKVESGDLLLEITTDKATVEHNALDEGWLKKIIVKEGSSASINDPIAIFTVEQNESIEGYALKAPVLASKKIEQHNDSAQETAAPVMKSSATSAMMQPVFEPEEPLKNYQYPFMANTIEGKLLATPLAKKIAKDKNLDLSTVKGSGPNGRIMSEDLALAIPKSVAHSNHKEAPELAPGSYEEVEMTAIQTVVANRLQAAKTFIPHFYINQNVQVTALMRVRAELKNQNINVSFNDLMIRAAALALKEHPKINSGFNSKNQKIIRFKTIDIAVAVSLQEGLITPIIRHADYKNVQQISLEVKQLAQKARDNQLKMEEFKGGSFTISNLGMYGITSVLPVINPPQAAILGVGGIEEVPKIEKDLLALSYQMTLTLAADHRAINGEDGAKFLATLKKLIENPSVLLI